MGLNNNIYKDVMEALETIETQSHSDKVKTLSLLLEKYAHRNKAEHLMDYHDLQAIIEGAKNRASSRSFAKCLMLRSLTKRINTDENLSLCLIESTVEHINKLDCLKRLPKFDYRDETF